MTGKVIILAQNKDMLVKVPTGRFRVPAGKMMEVCIHESNPILGVEEIGPFQPQEGRIVEFIVDDHGPSQPRG